jgi:hypothetical protein
MFHHNNHTKIEKIEKNRFFILKKNLLWCGPFPPEDRVISMEDFWQDTVDVRKGNRIHRVRGTIIIISTKMLTNIFKIF